LCGSAQFFYINTRGSAVSFFLKLFCYINTGIAILRVITTTR
jgi:hypothetical protein